MRQKWYAPLLIGLLLAIVVGCGDNFPSEFPAPDFTLKSPITGKKTSLSDYKGTPLILYWFTSW
ncbi:MAG: hypothetical protein D6726_12240 [Nitrospirae bacterium]|nr:MAG: hypothetical protein D6726_12240 [Nitrospirota bacterium]